MKTYNSAEIDIKEEFLNRISQVYDNSSNIKKTEINDHHLDYNEKLGMFFAILSTFCNAFGSFYTKLIQKTYPNDFHVVQFLFLRCFTLFIFTLIHCKITKQRIYKISEIPHKGFFFIRTNANFFGVACLTMALWYLRASTTIIIQSIYPIIVIILSYFILHEKLYFRYVIGIIMCFSGSGIIVLNEKRNNSQNTNYKEGHEITFSDTLIGLFFAFIDIIFISSVSISNKVLVNAKVPVVTQMFYVCISTFTYSSIYTIFFGGVVLKKGYLFMCLIHGIFFYLGNILYNKALQFAPLSKLVLIQYLNVVFVFILAFIFLHEKIYFTDILGAGIMISYMAYNSYYPLPPK
jgi:drug/metabolite transporter (DMT)-like permease